MMHKRSRNKDEDINKLAKSIVDEATEEPKEQNEKELSEEKPEKNPAAVALGRLGGKKGGPARAKKLSEKRRKEIARKAAKTRWAKK